MKRRTKSPLDVAEQMLRRMKRAEEFAERKARLDENEQPLLLALRQGGFDVGSVWDFVNTSASYPGAIPILHQHLDHDYDPAIRDGIIRALAVKEARYLWPEMRRRYETASADNTREKEAYAVFLSAVASRDQIPEVVALAKDRKHGPSRVLLLGCLKRSKRPEAVEALLDLSTDPDLATEIEIWRKRRARRAATIQAEPSKRVGEGTPE